MFRVTQSLLVYIILDGRFYLSHPILIDILSSRLPVKAQKRGFFLVFHQIGYLACKLRQRRSIWVCSELRWMRFHSDDKNGVVTGIALQLKFHPLGDKCRFFSLG